MHIRLRRQTSLEMVMFAKFITDRAYTGLILIISREIVSIQHVIIIETTTAFFCTSAKALVDEINLVVCGNDMDLVMVRGNALNAIQFCTWKSWSSSSS